MIVRHNFQDYSVKLTKVSDHWNEDENCYEVTNDSGEVLGRVYSTTITSSKIKGSPFRKNIIGYKEWTALTPKRARYTAMTRRIAIMVLIDLQESK